MLVEEEVVTRINGQSSPESDGGILRDRLVHKFTESIVPIAHLNIYGEPQITEEQVGFLLEIQPSGKRLIDEISKYYPIFRDNQEILTPTTLLARTTIGILQAIATIDMQNSDLTQLDKPWSAALISREAYTLYHCLDNPALNGSAPFHRFAENDASAHDLRETYEMHNRGGFYGAVLRESLNAQGAFNRKEMVRDKAQQIIELAVNEKRQIYLLSIAGGSSQALLEAIAAVPASTDYVNLVVLDIDKAVLDLSSKVAEELNVPQSTITGVPGNVLRLLDDTTDKFDKLVTQLTKDLGIVGYDFIEAAGILDYFQDNDMVINLIRNVRSHLAQPNAHTLFTNIAENTEMSFLHQAVGWRFMRYRTFEEMKAITEELNFSHIQIEQTPEGIYTVVTGN